MSWIYLLIAAVLEIGWAIGLKYSANWTKLWPTVGTVLCMIASYIFLEKSLSEIPLGTAYAVWTGIGAVGTAILSMVIFNEPATTARILCILLIVSGVLGLKFFS